MHALYVISLVFENPCSFKQLFCNGDKRNAYTIQFLQFCFKMLPFNIQFQGKQFVSIELESPEILYDQLYPTIPVDQRLKRYAMKYFVWWAA